MKWMDAFYSVVLYVYFSMSRETYCSLSSSEKKTAFPDSITKRPPAFQAQRVLTFKLVAKSQKDGRLCFSPLSLNHNVKAWFCIYCFQLEFENKIIKLRLLFNLLLKSLTHILLLWVRYQSNHLVLCQWLSSIICITCSLCIESWVILQSRFFHWWF